MMKNWLMGGAAAVCLALCLTSCSDSEDEEKVYAVAPQWAGKITFTPSEDIRPGEKVTASILLPTGGENIATASYTWNDYIDGTNDGTQSTYTFTTGRRGGTYIVSFEARYTFSMLDATGNSMCVLRQDTVCAVESCDAFGSNWTDNVARTCQIYPSLKLSDDDPNVYTGRVMDWLSQSSTGTIVRDFYFQNDRLARIKEEETLKSSTARSYVDKLAQLREKAEEELFQVPTREYYVSEGAPGDTVDIDFNQSGNEWKDELGAQLSAGTVRVYSELHSKYGVNTIMRISVANCGNGDNEVRFTREYKPAR